MVACLTIGGGDSGEKRLFATSGVHSPAGSGRVVSGLVLTEEIVQEIIGGLLPEWLDDANCKGMDPAIFFPDPWAGQSVAPAKAICAECVVRSECLDWALGHEENDGVWGGTSQRERRRIKRRA